MLFSGFARIEQALDNDALSSAHVPREKEKDSVVVEHDRADSLARCCFVVPAWGTG